MRALAHKTPPTLRPALASLAIAASLAALPAAAHEAAHAAPGATMMITGSAELSAAPDQAVITVAVEGTGTTADQAMAENTERMTSVFARMAALGLEASDLSTSGLSLSPRYDDRNSGTAPRISGYVVQNQIAVTVDDLDILGNVLDGLVSSGANSISQVNFALSDSAALEAEARLRAVQDARRKAEGYAMAIGTDITGVIAISEIDMRPMPLHRTEMMSMAMADSAETGGPVPVAAGDLTVSAQVSVAFQLSGSLSDAMPSLPGKK